MPTPALGEMEQPVLTRTAQETALGASASVQARPVGPTCTLHDTHFKIATRLRFMVTLVCPCDPLRLRTNHRRNVWPVSGTTGHHALLCSRAHVSWRHHIIAETWQAICRDAGLSAYLKQKAAEFPPGEFRRVSSIAEASQGISWCTELSSSPHTRVADCGRGRSRRTRGAPKAPRIKTRRINGLHGETSPIGLREPRSLRTKRCRRAGATGKIERRLDGGITDGGGDRRNRQPRTVASLVQRRAPSRKRGDGARPAGTAPASADRRRPAPGRERYSLGSE